MVCKYLSGLPTQHYHGDLRPYQQSSSKLTDTSLLLIQPRQWPNATTGIPTQTPRTSSLPSGANAPAVRAVASVTTSVSPTTCATPRRRPTPSRRPTRRRGLSARITCPAARILASQGRIARGYVRRRARRTQCITIQRRCGSVVGWMSRGWSAVRHRPRRMRCFRHQLQRI